MYRLFPGSKPYFVVGFFLMATTALWGQPVINSFAPLTGPAGTTVTLSGAGFSSTPSANIVYFGPVKAVVSAATGGSLTVTVPSGASSQPPSVTVNGRTASAPLAFIVSSGFSLQLSDYTLIEQHDYPAGLHPNGAVLADLDGDGRPDIATANNYILYDGPASITVLRNTSIRTQPAFQDTMQLLTGGLTYDVEAADLDGDGLKDLVCISATDKTVSIFRNTSIPGQLSFAPRISYPTGTTPYSIACNDIDGDGRPDIGVANFLSGNILLYRNTSSGGLISFQQQPEIVIGNLTDLALSDINGDGQPDLLAVDYLNKAIAVFRNTSTNGTFSWAAVTNIPVGTDRPYGLACADIDRDGKNDLLVTFQDFTTAATSAIAAALFRNTSSGNTISFAPKFNLNGGGEANRPAVNDLNGDGIPDIIVPRGDGNTFVYQNGSVPGTFSMPILTSFSFLSAYDVLSADLDGDSLNDFAISGYVQDYIRVCRNSSKTAQVGFFSPTTGTTGTSVQVLGRNFGQVTAVSFGGIPVQSFVINSATQLTAIVGAGASGSVRVTNEYGTTTLEGFTFNGPPSITSFSPVEGDSGTIVTINGYNFDALGAVQFGGIPAVSYTVINPSQIRAVLGSGNSGAITVSNINGTGSRAGFTVVQPVISSFTPLTAGLRDSVTITGNHFSAVTAVYFGGAPALGFRIVSPTEIRAAVGGGSSGAVTVQTARLYSLPGFTYQYIPRPFISALTPAKGPVGSSVTITGSGFASDPAKNQVRFGDVKAVVTAAAAAGSITVTVPGGASYEPVTVTNLQTNLGSANGLPFNVTLNSPLVVDTGLYTAQFRTGRNLIHPQTGDLDGDGLAEMVYQASGLSNNYIVIHKNGSTPGHLFFNDSLFINMNGGTPGANRVGDIVLTDMDGDSRPDIVALHLSFAGADEVYVYRNTSSLNLISFAEPVKMRTRIGYNVSRLWVQDLDGDGRADILLDGGALVVYQNTSIVGRLLFRQQQVFTQGSEVIEFVDVDGDGLPDAILTDAFNLKVWKNTSVPGTIQWGPVTQVYSNVYDHFITGFSKGDLNSDGKIDLLLVNSANERGSFATLLNTSTAGTFSFNASDYSIDSLPYFGIIGDADGDGKPDVILSEKVLPQRFMVLRNISQVTSSLALAPKKVYATHSFYEWGMTSADFDNDGKLDVVLGGNGIEIFRYSTTPPPLVTPAGPLEFCALDSVVLQANAASGVSWYKGTDFISNSSNKLVVYESGTFAAAVTSNGVISPLSNKVVINRLALPDKPLITVDGTGSMVSTFGAQYQWYADPATIIPGATGATYKPAKAGLYRVKVWVNGCSSPLSDAYSYSPTAIVELGNGQLVKLYPNPVRDRLYLQYAGNRPARFTVKLYSMDGRLVLQQASIKSGEFVSMSQLSRALYQVVLINENTGKSSAALLLHDK